MSTNDLHSTALRHLPEPPTDGRTVVVAVMGLAGRDANIYLRPSEALALAGSLVEAAERPQGAPVVFDVTPLDQVRTDEANARGGTHG